MGDCDWTMDCQTIFTTAGCVALGAAATLAFQKFTKPGIQRLNKDGEAWDGVGFAAPIVIHNGMVYISGQVGWKDKPQAEGPWSEECIAAEIEGQTKRTLEKIDSLLKAAGTSKDNILTTKIWLKNISGDFNRMNSVYKPWAGESTAKGVRACVESSLARECLKVEIQVVAAL